MTEREFLYVLEDGKAGVSIAVQLVPLERDALTATARAYIPYDWNPVWVLVRMAYELASYDERRRTEPRLKFHWNREGDDDDRSIDQDDPQA